jgi:dolichol-phosphate mannosyltransferase
LKKLISIITPVYNEEESIPIFYEELTKVVSVCEHKYDFEFIFTNNASIDSTFELIKRLRAKDPRVKLISFSRNFGYQSSILGGITYAKGDGIVIIDVDGEDPPNMIPKFIEKWEEGYEVVYGRRGKRPEPFYVTQLRFLFYRILRWIADSDIILDMAEFSLFSRNVQRSILDSKNTFPFLRAEIAYSGFKKYGINYDRHPRWAGRTHYNLLGMCAFAVAGMLSISTFPLRLTGYTMPILFIFNVIVATVALISASSFLLIILIWMNSLYMCFLGAFLGLYTARIYKNGVSRSVFIIDWNQSWL